MSSVLAAWQAAGQPEPNWQGKAVAARAAPSTRPGVCALTGISGAVYDVRHCVSEQFTGWDMLSFRHADPEGLAFCRAAAWAFRLRIAMQRPHVLDCDGFRQVDPAGLYAALCTLPNNRTGFVSAPVSGQKHLLPWAQPGALITDSGRLDWTTSDAIRLDTYRRLREAGFGEAALAETAPRWPILTRLSPCQIHAVLDDWPLLDPWRRTPIYLDIAARATRKPKETQ